MNNFKHLNKITTDTTKFQDCKIKIRQPFARKKEN